VTPACSPACCASSQCENVAVAANNDAKREHRRNGGVAAGNEIEKRQHRSGSSEMAYNHHLGGAWRSINGSGVCQRRSGIGGMTASARLAAAATGESGKMK